MITAALNTRIKIEVETTTKNSVGTPKEDYEHLKYKYCTVKNVSGDTQFNEGAMPFTNTEFSIRHDDEVTYKCRVLYNNEYYKILHIELIGGRKDGMRLKCVKWDE